MKPGYHIRLSSTSHEEALLTLGALLSDDVLEISPSAIRSAKMHMEQLLERHRISTTNSFHTVWIDMVTTKLPMNSSEPRLTAVDQSHDDLPKVLLSDESVSGCESRPDS